MEEPRIFAQFIIEHKYCSKESSWPKTMGKRELRFHHVNFLAFTGVYAWKEAQVHTDVCLIYF